MITAMSTFEDEIASEPAKPSAKLGRDGAAPRRQRSPR
jgi:hypothetical protein